MPAAGRARWLTAPAAAALFALGVWAAGAVPDGFRVAMALTAAWYVAAAAAVLVTWRRSHALRLPLLAGVVVTATAIGAFLAWSTLRDRVVDERVARGPALAAGAFRSVDHATTGRAAVVMAGTRRFLTLEDFRRAAGPDLRVRLVPGVTTDGGADGAVDLGALKGNVGDQQYRLPAGLELADFGGVVVWCRAFSAPFGRAPLAA